MKLSLSNRYDSRGFRLSSKILSVSAHCWPCYQALPGFLLRIDFGKGADYVRGASAYFGFHTRGGGDGAWPRKRSKLKIGFTKNGNKIPFHFA